MSARPRGPQPSGPRAPGPREKTCCWSASSWLHLLRSWSLRSTRGGSLTVFNASLIIALAHRYRMPDVHALAEAVALGGLVSYGINWNDQFRHAAEYVDRILKGTKPADLPVEQPTKFELVINLKTAKTIGLEIPPPLLTRADQVIE